MNTCLSLSHTHRAIQHLEESSAELEIALCISNSMSVFINSENEMKQNSQLWYSSSSVGGG